MENYKKTVVAYDGSMVLASVFCDGKLRGEKLFGSTDCSFLVLMFGNYTKQREAVFKMSHKWADEFIEQMEKFEVVS